MPGGDGTRQSAVADSSHCWPTPGLGSTLGRRDHSGTLWHARRHGPKQYGQAMPSSSKIASIAGLDAACRTLALTAVLFISNRMNDSPFFLIN